MQAAANGKAPLTNKSDQLQNKRRGRGPNIPIEIKEFVRDHSAIGHTPREIHDQMTRLQARGESFGDLVLPGLRAIQGFVNKLPAPDASAPWSLVTDETGEPRVVLDT